MRHHIARLMVAAALLTAQAGGLAQTMDEEINRLLAHIVSSRCQFYRNGEWHDAQAAKAHIERKLASLKTRGVMKQTEDFITYAASKSSMTGERYKIKCAGAATQDAQAWLLAHLKSIRQAP